MWLSNWIMETIVKLTVSYLINFPKAFFSYPSFVFSGGQRWRRYRVLVIMPLSHSVTKEPCTSEFLWVLIKRPKNQVGSTQNLYLMSNNQGVWLPSRGVLCHRRVPVFQASLYLSELKASQVIVHIAHLFKLAHMMEAVSITITQVKTFIHMYSVSPLFSSCLQISAVYYNFRNYSS